MVGLRTESWSTDSEDPPERVVCTREEGLRPEMWGKACGCRQCQTFHSGSSGRGGGRGRLGIKVGIKLAD